MSLGPYDTFVSSSILFASGDSDSGTGEKAEHPKPVPAAFRQSSEVPKYTDAFLFRSLQMFQLLKRVLEHDFVEASQNQASCLGQKAYHAAHRAINAAPPRARYVYFILKVI